MSNIRIESDRLRETYVFLNQQAYILLDEFHLLNQSVTKLDFAWQGTSANNFLDEVSILQKELQKKIEELFVLSQRLNREADRWEESDQIWVQEYRKIFYERINFGG